MSRIMLARVARFVRLLFLLLLAGATLAYAYALARNWWNGFEVRVLLTEGGVAMGGALIALAAGPRLARRTRLVLVALVLTLLADCERRDHEMEIRDCGCE